MAAINLQEKLAKFSEHWSPKIVSTYNGNDVMVVKIKGEFVWHSHPETDDFFLVLKGKLRIDLRNSNEETSHVELDPANSTSFLAASNIAPWPSTRSIFYSSNPRAHRTPAIPPPRYAKSASSFAA